MEESTTLQRHSRSKIQGFGLLVWFNASATSKDHQLEVGQKVLMSDSAAPVGLVPKLHVPYKGPYVILQEGLNNTFHLRDANGKWLPHPIHANRLRLFHERSEEEQVEIRQHQ